MIHKKIFIITLFLISVFVRNGYSQVPVFKNGDRVCFIGSSIAMNGTNFFYINLFYATRYPNIKITFLNSGISGDHTTNILRRLETDILSRQPNWAVLMIEENDLNPSLYYAERQNEPGIMEKRQKALEKWLNNSDTIVQKLLAANINVILQTPTIYDQTGDLPSKNGFGVNDALQQCANHLKQLAKKYTLPLVDCWTILNNINKTIQEKDSKKSIIGNDRVHVSPMGYFVMAYQFLKSSPVLKNVSAITIDKKREKVTQQLNCAVGNLKFDKTNLSFTGEGKSLPFPSPEGVNVDSFFQFTDELNAEIIQVKRLPRGTYRIMIDTFATGTFTNVQLNTGINLSRYKNTPQYVQASEVLRLFDEYWRCLRKLRQVKYVEYQLMDNEMRQTPLTKENGKELIAKRMEKFEDQDKAYVDFYQRNFNEYLINKPMEKELQEKAGQLFNEIYQANKPFAHHYKIERTD